jgi:N-acetyl-anhydromuramyl-L-alanine amidase AmpD
MPRPCQKVHPTQFGKSLSLKISTQQRLLLEKLIAASHARPLTNAHGRATLAHVNRKHPSLTPDWNKIFSEAHTRSWPTASLCIQNRDPNPDQGSRNIFEEDEKEIMAAAKAYGYEMMLHTTDKTVSFFSAHAVVSFVHPTLKGTLYG